MKLYIVRHGETKYNEKKIIQGHLDIPLSDEGIRQAKKLAKRLEVINFDCIYTSDLKRAKQTAKEISKYQNCPIIISKLLRETNMGRFQGGNKDDLLDYVKKHPEILYEKMPGNGESYSDVQKRAIKFINRIYNKHINDTILISTHGGIKKFLLMHFKDIKLEDFRKQKFIKNSSLSIASIHKENKYKIILENDIKHLNI